MMLLKRTAAAAVLLLAPVQASASEIAAASARDFASAIGEKYGYMENCLPDMDRKPYRRAAMLELVETVFPDPLLPRFSLAWDLGKLQGLVATCDVKTWTGISDRLRQALDDVQVAVHKAIAAQKAKAAKK